MSAASAVLSAWYPYVYCYCMNRLQTIAAFRRSAIPSESKVVNGRNVSCHPCHAGWISCDPKKTGARQGYHRPSADVMCGAMQATVDAWCEKPISFFGAILYQT